MRNVFFTLLALTFSCNAFAGVVRNGEWEPTSCGPKLVAPSLDLSGADAYNRSVDAVNTYRQQIKPYIDCVVKEANADIQVITQSATQAQLIAKQANERIQADVKAAEEKLK